MVFLDYVVVSDNGPQFISHELQEYLTAQQILHQQSAPYHPATNGLAKGMVKNVKQAGAIHFTKHLTFPAFCALTKICHTL